MTPNKNSRVPSKRKSNRTLFLAIGIIAIILIGVGAYIMFGQSANQPANPTPTPTSTPAPTSSTSPSATPTDPHYVNPTKVLLQTSAGNITLELRTDKPITTANFINIVSHGWYDGTTFHRVIAGFMIQGGQISQSISAIADEIGSDNHNTEYTITMAKTSQPNSATSEFFINAVDNSKITYQDGSTFDGTYSVFGRVVAGQSVVDSIANAQVSADPYTHEMSVPVHPVSVIKATIIS
jgi:cyclophilin family peptidyl-prolyl cis-trans isomerase